MNRPGRTGRLHFYLVDRDHPPRHVDVYDDDANFITE
jgi:hypothetical protein